MKLRHAHSIDPPPPRTHRLLGEGVTSPPETSKRVLVPLCGKARSYLHWSPYDRVGVVNADP
jgi:hypothetical protein